MATFVWMPTAATASYERGYIGGGWIEQENPPPATGVSVFRVPGVLGRRVWALSFANRSADTAASIIGFLESQGVFTWTPPTGPEAKWRCSMESVASEVVAHGRQSISAIFIEMQEGPLVGALVPETPFTWTPSLATCDRKGYAIGLAYPQHYWTLTFMNVSTATASEIENFLNSGGVFEWTPPSEEAKKWTCAGETLSIEITAPGRATVTCEFAEIV